jgi:hypothetical protein
MGRLKPYSGTSLDRLVLEINRINNLHLVYGEDFTLSMPWAATGSNGRNTEVTFTPLVFNGGFKQQVLRYTRLNLDVLGKLPEGAVLPVFIKDLPTTARAILGTINEALGIDLSPEEVEDTPYPPKVFDTKYPLKIAEGVSYGWIGEYDFAVEVDNKLSNVILFTTLGRIADPFLSPEGTYNPEQELLNLISDANPGVTFRSGDLAFSEVVGVGAIEDGYALSQIEITATEASGFYGSVKVLYYRRSLSVFGDDLSIISELPITTEMAYDHLVDSRDNTNLAFTDIVPFTAVGTDVGDIDDIAVYASTTSLAWGGSVNIAYLFGLPANISKLHVCVNKTLPSTGYLS